ncbi:MAG: glycosyltransferase [Thermoflexales bacterium]|nr:glycosyltransferase [Thermoflexales bacterium]
MLVSVIIPTYYRTRFLQDALASVATQSFPHDQYEILVVDNAPQPTELVALDGPTLSPPVRYVHEANCGLHNARHAGAKAAEGEILVYIDDDVLCPPGWLAAMCGPYEDPQVACVGGKVVADWELEPPAWLSGVNLAYLSLLDLDQETSELAWPRTVYGCNMSVRKPVLFEVGGFNPDGFGDRRLIWRRGDGETGLQYKVYHAGYKVIYVPGACLRHRVPASRLRPAYFQRRAFDQGISESYAAFRTAPSLVNVLRRMLVASSRYTGLSLKSALAFKSQTEKMRCWMAASHAWAQFLHSLRLLASPSLRRYVLQENYF